MSKENCSNNGHYTITVRESPQNVRQYTVSGNAQAAREATLRIAAKNPNAQVSCTSGKR